MRLSEISIHAFIVENGIKNEVGDPIDFRDHLFLFDIYRDFSQKLVIMKAAQVGATTMECIKTLYGVRNKGLDSIYILPTYEDVNTMVGSKVNRIIAQNPVFQRWTADKDTIDQKQIGDHYIHFRGSWTSKAAIMVSSDWNCYDEIDACKPEVIEQYATRLQHSKYKMEHYFSHPSAQGYGVDRYWQKSDQKHWFIRCKACEEWQYMSWPESVDPERECYQCKNCKKELDDDTRRAGKWVAKYKNREFSGYWIPLLICPWVKASEILAYKRDKSEEYFYNKVLGLPYVGSGNKLTRHHFFQNLTTENLYPQEHEKVVMGLDTGTQLYYVLGTERGIFHYGIAKDYGEVEELMVRWPRMTVICDQMGDLIGSRALREKYPGRVYLCLFGEDRKTKELIRWGKHDENGSVIADRNRMFRLLVGEFIDKRIPVMGTEEDWDEYMIHWGNLTQVTIMDDTTGLVKGKKWIKNGQSDFPFCFTGDTLVQTSTGEKEIKNVVAGDLVLTRNGYRKVVKSGLTKRNADVYRFSTDVMSVLATRDHRFLIEGKGFAKAEEGDTVVVCKRNQHELTGYSSRDTQKQNKGLIGSIFQVLLRVRKYRFIGTYIKQELEKYQKDLLCTIKMVMRLIMPCLIFPLSQEVRINQNMRKTLGETLMQKSAREWFQKKLKRSIFGIVPMKVKKLCQNGLKISIEDLSTAKFVKRLKKLRAKERYSVQRNVDRYSFQENGELNTQTTRLNTIRYEKNADVYDIEVEGEHEFFANGFLVHNCTLYWRIGMERMGSNGAVLMPEKKVKYPRAPVILPGNKMHNTKVPMFEDKKSNDWRV